MGLLTSFTSALASRFRRSAPSEPAPVEVPPERRLSQRQRAYVNCSVTFTSGFVSRGVLIERSLRGARVRFAHKPGLPDTVCFRMEGLGHDVPARVVWQDDCDAGLAFAQPRSA